MSSGLEAAVSAVRGGMSKRQAARQYDVPRSTLRDHLARSGATKLEEVGYDCAAPDTTPEEAWNEHKGVFEQELSRALKKNWRPIKRPRGPFCIFHSTDEHLDDNKTPLALLEADIRAAREMNAIMCHGGDALNNWPMAGRLAKQWSEQECTAPKALLRLQHFIEIFEPEVWTDGNHEEMNPYLEHLISSYLPKNVIRDYWNVNFVVKTPGGRDIKCILSHKFQKGSSWFHPHHGVIRETLEGEEADLYMEGHIHTAGVLYRTLPERRHRAVAVSSAGYKVMDKWATRISRGGKMPKLDGRAHWIIGDPECESDEFPLQAFDSPQKAEAYLSGLQNLRAA